MTDKYLELFTEISNKLGEMNGKMSSVLGQLADHNVRIQNLEKQGPGAVKENLVKWLAIALLGSISVIATLTGSGAILKQILGM